MNPNTRKDKSGKARLALVATAALIAWPGARAATANDAVGDFIPSYVGQHLDELDVVSSFVNYNPATDMFTFSGTMHGAINKAGPSFYVWGINRGPGTAGFAALGDAYKNILFDTVVILRADGTGRGPGGNLLPGTVVLDGNTISATFAGSFLPKSTSATLPNLEKAEFTWNLWPRTGAPGITGNPAVSDFAPDATDQGVAVVPEPATLVLMGLGLGALALGRRRRF